MTPVTQCFKVFILEMLLKLSVNDCDVGLGRGRVNELLLCYQLNQDMWVWSEQSVCFCYLCLCWQGSAYSRENWAVHVTCCHMDTVLQSDLTHWGHDKMAGIFQTFSNAFSWMKMYEFHWFLPKGPINNIPVLVQIMAWGRPGDKPLSEPMLVKFTDAYICPSASMS